MKLFMVFLEQHFKDVNDAFRHLEQFRAQAQHLDTETSFEVNNNNGLL